jgi:hypothetical protein
MRPSKLRSPPAVMSHTQESMGRIRHDERGAAVWDWAIEPGVFDALSSSAVLRRLDVADLTIQKSPGLALATTDRDAGGGGDPYNFRGSVPSRTRHR